VQKSRKGLIFIGHLLPAIIWGVGIFIVISIPESAIPKVRLLNIEHIDKVIHFALFFIFSLLLCFGFFKQNLFRSLQGHYMVYAISISVIYGGFTEVIQATWLISRSGNVWDFFANITGAITGALIFYGLFKNKLLKNLNKNKL